MRASQTLIGWPHLLVLLFLPFPAQQVLADGKQHALLVCGLSGSEEYREQYEASVDSLRRNLVERLGVPEKNVRIQFGCSETEEPVTMFPVHGNATAKELEAEAERLAALDADATVWVFVLGHSYYDGRQVFLNLPDEDINAEEFGLLFKSVRAKGNFVVSAPASGFFMKHLSGDRRIVITSSAADAETNGSMFHVALCEAFDAIVEGEDPDVDKDGAVSMLDLYVKTSMYLMDRYYGNDPPLIPTEHPQLDDNGDGRGSEVQIDYLTMAQGGRADSKRVRRLRQFKDGKRAAAFTLHLVETSAADTTELDEK